MCLKLVGLCIFLLYNVLSLVPFSLQLLSAFPVRPFCLVFSKISFLLYKGPLCMVRDQTGKAQDKRKEGRGVKHTFITFGVGGDKV